MIHDLGDRFEPVGFLDDDSSKHGATLEGLPILGPLASAAGHGDAQFVTAIGSPSTFAHRDAIVESTGLPAARFATLIHPTASISGQASIAPGAVVHALTAVRPYARLDAGVLVLAGAVVNHDVVLGEHTVVASGVNFAGGVRVGRCCYIGANSSILGDVTIGDRAMVGMGAVVLRDVQPGTTVVGNPARPIR